MTFTAPLYDLAGAAVRPSLRQAAARQGPHVQPASAQPRLPQATRPRPLRRLAHRQDVGPVYGKGGTIHRCIDISRYFSRDTYRDIIFYNSDFFF